MMIARIAAVDAALGLLVTAPIRGATTNATSTPPNNTMLSGTKVGTVSQDVAGAVKNAKSGQVRYRVDKAGIVHCSIGKASFESAQLKDNLMALLADLQKAKPATSKGVFLKRVTLSSTMGPGVPVENSSLG